MEKITSNNGENVLESQPSIGKPKKKMKVQTETTIAPIRIQKWLSELGVLSRRQRRPYRYRQ